MKNTAEKLEFEGPIKCRPFVKWVGGKTQLLPELLKRVPPIFKRYFEGFVGGGALFFALQPKATILLDANAELIDTYCVVRDEVTSLIADLQKHYYENNYFYSVRNIDRLPAFKSWSKIQKASRLIYLNKTCFNGLYRVNSKGHFNTPFGRYTNPTIVDHENLLACSKALQKVEIRCEDFTWMENQARSGDFVYFDPPYVPVNSTSNFTSYQSSGFNLDMQKKLFEVCQGLDRKGVKFMLSNSSVPFIKHLYRPFNVQIISAKRAINSKATKRGAIEEVVVTNY